MGWEFSVVNGALIMISRLGLKKKSWNSDGFYMDLWWSRDNNDVFFCAQQKLFVFAAFKTAWSHPKHVCQTSALKTPWNSDTTLI